MQHTTTSSKVNAYMYVNTSLIGASGQNVFNYTNGALNHFLMTRNATHWNIYKNGVLITSISSSSNFPVTEDFAIGARADNLGENYKGTVSRVSLFDVEFNTSQVEDSYNSGSGRDWLTYNTTPAPVVNNGITFISQVPTNLTAFSLFTQSFNVTYNYTNETLSMTNIGLNYSLTSSKSCLMYVNSSCAYTNNTITTVNYDSTSRTGNTTTQSYLLTENMLYPSTAIRNSTFFNVNHSIHTMTGSNDFLAYKLLNISTTNSTNLLELMINDTAVSRIYLCNSSINLTGAVNPLTNTNCQEIGSVDSTGFNHTHGTYSAHNVIPFSIINGKINGIGITVTNNMWIVARGNTLGIVRVGYVANGSLSTSVYYTINGGNTWNDSSATMTIDSHLHQYDGTEYVNYYAYGTFNVTQNVSATISDFIDVPPTKPSPATITVPFETTQATRFLNITYLNGTANTFGTSIAKYNITLLNSDLTYNRTITANNGVNNSYYYDLYAQNLSTGIYYVRVYTYDNLNNSAFDEEWFNLTRNAVVNVTLYDYSTNASVSNYSLNITDYATNITEEFNTTGALLNVDVVKSHNYTISFDANNYAYYTINYSTNTSFIQKLNQSLYKTNSVNIIVLDESSLSLITNVTTGGPINITFISNLSSISYNTTTGYLFVSNITEGFYEVKFQANNYASRSYYVTVTNRSTQSLNAYLSQSAINLLLTYVNKETGELLEGCGVVVAKVINGTWTTVSSGFTDITGRVQFSVSTSTNYRFSSTCLGYDDKTFNLNPVIFTSYTVQLTKQPSSADALDFTNINVYLTNTTFKNNGTNTFIWQISAPSGNLESYGYRVYTRCKNVTSYSGVNAYGGISSVSFNLTCANLLDKLYVYYNYTLSGGDLREFTQSFSITGNTSSNTNTWISNKDTTYGLGLLERILIAVSITIVMAGLIAKFSNMVAGLGAGLLVISYMSYIGFVDWWLIAPSLLVGFIVLASLSRSG